jgi:hypothetical protein
LQVKSLPLGQKMFEALTKECEKQVALKAMKDTVVSATAKVEKISGFQWDNKQRQC